MPEPPAAQEPQEQPILTILQQIKDGTISPRTLTREQRQACVEALILEGYALAGIAQIVERSEKTITRDLAEIRSRNALTPSPELARQLIGGLLMKSEAHQARLMRLARDTEGSVGERAQAELAAWQVARDTMKLLQSLGYLPERPQQVIGNVVHRFGEDREESSLAQTEATLQDITRIAQETNQLTPELTAKLAELQQHVDHAKLNQAAQQLLTQCQNPQPSKETSDVPAAQ